MKTKVEKLPKVNSYLLVALGLLASATISFFLIIPAIIFFPITIAFGIVSACAALVSRSASYNCRVSSLCLARCPSLSLTPRVHVLLLLGRV